MKSDPESLLRCTAGPKTLNRFSSGLLAGVALGTIAHVATSQSHAEGQVKSAASSAQKVAEELKR